MDPRGSHHRIAIRHQMQKLTSNVSETPVSRSNGGTTKGSLFSSQYNVLWFSKGFQRASIGPHDAKRRRSLGQLHDFFLPDHKIIKAATQSRYFFGRRPLGILATTHRFFYYYCPCALVVRFGRELTA